METGVRGGGVQPNDFVHEAVFYAGLSDFTAQMATFIRDGVAADEPTLVVVSAEKIELLRDELGPQADEVLFADMAEVGSNPARIIPAWTDFVVEHGGDGRRLRGVGEPISGDRSPDALAECVRHEALLNLAFADSQPWWLVCPYDTESLAPDVLEAARRTHPAIAQNGVRKESPTYVGLEAVAQPFEEPLSEPTGHTEEMVVEAARLGAARRFVAGHAAAAGLSSSRVAELVLAVNELVTNSVRYGGGGGTLRFWSDEDSVVCEVSDMGRIADPLVGRVSPTPERGGGYGLWLVTQLCDLVQIRTFPTGSVVRVHMNLSVPAADPAAG